MTVTALQQVFQSVVISRLTYAAPAWWGFMASADRQRIEAISYVALFELIYGPLPRRLIRRRLIISAPQPTKNCLTKLSQILTTFCMLFCRHHPMHPKTTIFVNAHIHSSCPIILLTSLTVILSHVWCIKTVTNNFIFILFFPTCIVLRSVRSFITIKWWWWWTP